MFSLQLSMIETEKYIKGAPADAAYKQEERDVDNEQQDCSEEQVGYLNNRGHTWETFF